MAPAEVNKALPFEPEEWQGFTYPVPEVDGVEEEYEEASPPVLL